MTTTYSAIQGEPIHITNIRAKRNQPGLKPQHLTTLKAASKICGARTRGVKIDSREIEFIPRKIKGGFYDIDIGTAGSISLLLQCLVPILAYANKKTILKITGGTAVNWSPPIPFLENVVYKAFKSLGIETRIQVQRHGFYPKGGGKVKATIQPIDEIKSINTKKAPKNPLIRGISICGKLPSHVAERQAKSTIQTLKKAGLKTNIKTIVLRKEKTPLSPGSLVCLWSHEKGVYMGADSLGARGKPSEKVGMEAAKSMIKQLETGSVVDKHTSDHLILPISLASGKSEFTSSEITLHTLTAIELAKTFTNSEFKIVGKQGNPGVITCIRR
jgi:RNA 3'-phosphate cyclase